MAGCRFLAGDDAAADARRDGILKLIPSIAKGSWIVRQSVGHTPVLLGKKLTTQYHRCAHVSRSRLPVPCPPCKQSN